MHALQAERDRFISVYQAGDRQAVEKPPPLFRPTHFRCGDLVDVRIARCLFSYGHDALDPICSEGLMKPECRAVSAAGKILDRDKEHPQPLPALRHLSALKMSGRTQRASNCTARPSRS